MRVPSRAQAPGRPGRGFQAGQKEPPRRAFECGESLHICLLGCRDNSTANKLGSGLRAHAGRGRRRGAARPGPPSLGRARGAAPGRAPTTTHPLSGFCQTFSLSPVGTKESESLLAKQSIFLKKKRQHTGYNSLLGSITAPCSDPDQRARRCSHRKTVSGEVSQAEPFYKSKRIKRMYLRMATENGIKDGEGSAAYGKPFCGRLTKMG